MQNMVANANTTGDAKEPVTPAAKPVAISMQKNGDVRHNGKSSSPLVVNGKTNDIDIKSSTSNNLNQAVQRSGSINITSKQKEEDTNPDMNTSEGIRVGYVKKSKGFIAQQKEVQTEERGDTWTSFSSSSGSFHTKENCYLEHSISGSDRCEEKSIGTNEAAAKPMQNDQNKVPEKRCQHNLNHKEKSTVKVRKRERKVCIDGQVVSANHKLIINLDDKNRFTDEVTV